MKSKWTHRIRRSPSVLAAFSGMMLLAGALVGLPRLPEQDPGGGGMPVEVWLESDPFSS